jgi:hypothetical protein
MSMTIDTREKRCPECKHPMMSGPLQVRNPRDPDGPRIAVAWWCANCHHSIEPKVAGAGEAGLIEQWKTIPTGTCIAQDAQLFVRTARKPHSCEKCGVEIASGDRYIEYLGEAAVVEYRLPNASRYQPPTDTIRYPGATLVVRDGWLVVATYAGDVAFYPPRSVVRAWVEAAE